MAKAEAKKASDAFFSIKKQVGQREQTSKEENERNK